MIIENLQGKTLHWRSLSALPEENEVKNTASLDYVGFWRSGTDERSPRGWKYQNRWLYFPTGRCAVILPLVKVDFHCDSFPTRGKKAARLVCTVHAVPKNENARIGRGSVHESVQNGANPGELVGEVAPCWSPLSPPPRIVFFPPAPNLSRESVFLFRFGTNCSASQGVGSFKELSRSSGMATIACCCCCWCCWWWLYRNNHTQPSLAAIVGLRSTREADRLKVFLKEALIFLMQVGASFALGPCRIRRVCAKLRSRGYREVGFCVGWLKAEEEEIFTFSQVVYFWSCV